MSKLNKDVFFLIFKELQDDKSSLYSCLLVNKTWCKIIIPILWKNPLMNLKAEKGELQFNVIISHLSNETRRNLDNQGINLPTVQQKPLFDYISFCKHLELMKLEFHCKCIELGKSELYEDIESEQYSCKYLELEYSCDYLELEQELSIILANEILKLFINGKTKISHLYIPAELNYQIHLIPGVEDCFSELKFLYCTISDADKNILELARIVKSIKILECVIVNQPNNSGIISLIEAQRNLNAIHFIHIGKYIEYKFFQTIEKSLIKHVDTIQDFKMDWEPTTKIFTHFENLISLDIKSYTTTNWSHLDNVSLPFLKTLKAELIPSKILASLIENTKGHLTEISISYGVVDNIIIQAIYQNCPNLKYLKLSFINDDIILELEKLLMNCQHLNGLVITNCYYTNNYYYANEDFNVDWDSLFEILVNSSPTSLFMFKFKVPSLVKIKLESLKLFFDNWKGRRPMLLQTIIDDWAYNNVYNYLELFEKYKAKGIIQKYDHIRTIVGMTNFEDFEWIQKKKFSLN